jgi:hypothetical protein
MPAKISTFQQKKMDEASREFTNLRSLEIEVASPLSQIDWKNLSLVINEVQGLAYVQILPED